MAAQIPETLLTEAIKQIRRCSEENALIDDSQSQGAVLLSRRAAVTRDEPDRTAAQPVD